MLLVVGFAVTGAIARGYHRRQTLLAERWFSRGNRDLANGSPQRAVDEIQTALAFSPDNDAYRLKLSLALVQSGKLDEARAHLVSLWEQRPGDATVNLQLARVMTRSGDLQNAIRYYHGAIYGVWDSHPFQSREAARFELADYLLSARQTAAAQSELIAVEAELPPGSSQQLRLGDMLMEAGEPERALIAYMNARKADRTDPQAELGVAKADFALRRFSEARDHARAALRINPHLEEAKQLHQQAQVVLAADPYLKGLNVRQRAERAQAAFEAANDRLDQCLATHTDPQFEALSAQQKTNFKHVRARSLRADPDMLDSVVQWAYDVERASEGTCGAPTGVDAGLLILAHGSGTR